MAYTGRRMTRLLKWFSEHRQRAARLLFVGGLLVVALQLGPHFPRETDVEFELGSEHQEVVELRVGFELEGEEMHGIKLGFPGGAPATVRHTLSLPAGEYVLLCELRAKDGASRQFTRRLVTPADGVVRIELPAGEVS
jgi:hypothetical protein